MISSLQLGLSLKISGKGEGAGRWGSLTLGKKWFWMQSNLGLNHRGKVSPL
jgi:hypothetical protein